MKASGGDDRALWSFEVLNESAFDGSDGVPEVDNKCANSGGMAENDGDEGEAHAGTR